NKLRLDNYNNCRINNFRFSHTNNLIRKSDLIIYLPLYISYLCFMLVSTTYEKTNLRELAALVSHAAFKRLSSSSNQSAYIRRMKKYVGWDELPHDKPNNLGDLIMYSYQILEQHYRHEYIYKNKLLSDFVLQNYALDDTILLNEFRIGQSIADTVLVNGTNKVFEIKTELDSPERLQSQLQDYFRSFTEVYVFTHKTLIEKYQKIL